MRRLAVVTAGMSLVAALAQAGCTGSSTHHTSGSASPCHVTAAHLRSPVRPDSTAAPTVRMSGSLAAHIRSAWVNPAPSNIGLAAAGTSGDIFFDDPDGIGRLAPGGQVRWSVSGRIGLRMFPTAHDVVAVGSTGDVAVLDGATGRVLACTSIEQADPIVGAPVVIHGDSVAVAQVSSTTTSVAKYTPGGATGFTTVGRVPGHWALLALSEEVAVLGGRIARMGPTGGAATRLAFLRVPDAPSTAPSASATLRPYSRPGPPADPDAYGDPLGSARAGISLTGPVAVPVLTAGQGDWLGAEPVDALRADVVVQDVYAPYTASSTSVGGGLAALDEHGRIRWRTAGAGRGQQIVTDGTVLTAVAAGRAQLRVLTIDESTGRTRTNVALPDGDPGIRTVTAAAGATWVRTEDRVVAVTSTGKQLTVTSRQPGELTAVAAAPSSTAAVVSTIRANNGATSYVLGP